MARLVVNKDRIESKIQQTREKNSKINSEKNIAQASHWTEVCMWLSYLYLFIVHLYHSMQQNGAIVTCLGPIKDNFIWLDKFTTIV